MKRFLQKGESLTYLLLAASLVACAVGAYRFFYLSRPDRTAYGESVERVTIHDSGGSRITSRPGTWRAFLVASPTDDIAVVRALRAAVADRARDGQPIEATVFARERSGSSTPVAMQSLAPLKIVPFSANEGVLSRDLHVTTKDRQLILVDPQGQVAFHGTHPRYTDVRLLFDRFLPLRQRPAGHQPLRIGDQLADIPLTRLSEQADAAGQAQRLWVVFTSRCTSCALSTHSGVVASLQKSVARFAEKRGSGAALVFAPSFDDQQVRQKMQTLGVTLPVYMATTDIPAIEGAAEIADADVLVIERDAANRITRVEPLTAFLQELTEDRV